MRVRSVEWGGEGKMSGVVRYDQWSGVVRVRSVEWVCEGKISGVG